MDQTEALRRAISVLRPDLPGLIGDGWPDFENRLNQLLRQLDADPQRAPITRAQILALFGEHPQAHKRLIAVINTGAAQDTIPLRSPADPQRAPSPVLRYTDISCPRRAQVNSRVTVTVALTMQPQPESVALQAIEVFEGKVRVRIDAPGFEPLSPLEQTIIIERDDDSAPVVFHLKARETGPHEIAIHFWQRGNLIATVVAPIEVLEMEPVFAPAFIPTTPVSPRMAEVTPPDLTLVIFRDPVGRMQFTLHRDNVTLCYAEQTLHRPPDALLNALFDELHLLQRGTDSANRRRGSHLLTAEQVERRICNLGYKLWDVLIPPELKLYYARERHQWQRAAAAGQRWSLLVQSNEPDIPWELVRPYSDGTDRWEEDFWYQTFHFARWLLRRPDSPECFAPVPRLQLSALAAIVPTCYPELKAVPDEHKLLRDLIARHRLTDRSPKRATEEEVIALLETGGFDWLHVITHGDFFAQSALHSSAIGLENGQWLASSAITGPRIRGTLRDHRPAIILNACHVGSRATLTQRGCRLGHAVRRFRRGHAGRAALVGQRRARAPLQRGILRRAAQP
ncbi:MAG: CHAT domain-containing protein [Roseiflexus sp.]|nr:CHAT domain-containing protein [Roseiflexus sp.]